MIADKSVVSLSWQLSVILVGVCVGLLSCILGAPEHHALYFYTRVYRLPGCSEGIDYFKNYQKCPDNWSCVHNLNRNGDDDSTMTDNLIQSAGYGNTRCCKGQHQSPVDITATSVACVGNLTTPDYVNPYATLFGKFVNKGYFPQFSVEADRDRAPLLLTGVPFTCSVYANDYCVFKSIHIHSGIRGIRGSSHLVQGRPYDAELHIVHTQSAFYHQRSGQMDMGCASQTPLGLAVIGVFLSLTEGQPNEELNQLLSAANVAKIWRTNADCNFMQLCNPFNSHAIALYCRRREYEELMLPQKVRRYGEEQCRAKYRRRNRTTVLNLSSPNHPCGQRPTCANRWKEEVRVRPGLLLPASRDYYQYLGSLTTPPCSEVVNWMVMKEPIRITSQQLDILQGLESANKGEPISLHGNFRPTQPLNDRIILHSSC